MILFETAGVSICGWEGGGKVEDTIMISLQALEDLFFAATG